MASHLTLNEAIESVASRAIKERAEGASDLRQILRHSQGTPKIDNLKEASIFKIFDALFSAIDLDLSIKRGNKPSKEKKPSIPAALLRLGSLAATLRVAVDVCLRNLKSKSIKALIDYIITNFTEADGSPITALAGDFASSLSILLAHEPHAEHLSPNLREEAITFCLAILNAECNHDEGLGSSILSSRSSRFHLAPSQADNGKNGLPRQAADDLVKALRSLTSVSFAPLLEKGPKLLDTMVQFVKTSPHMSKPQVDALVIINTTLLHVRTGDTESAKKFTRNAVALARALWNTKLAALKDEVLVMLVLLHPFIETLLQQGGDELFFIELANLVEVIKGDYVRRGAKDQLQLNQLTLRIAEKQPADGLQCWTFSLRDGLTVNENGLSCEHNWTLLKLSALFSVQNHVHGQRHVQRSVSPSDGPRKRLKVTQWSDEILRMLSDLSIPTRIYSLQIICFAAQCTPIEKRVLGTLVEKLSTYITDDNSSVASWAYLALTSCAYQAAARVEGIADNWNYIWRYTLRAVTSPSTCRTACHLLHVMIHSELVNRALVLENTGAMLSSISTNGPAVFCDSAATFLQTIMTQLQRESISMFGERAEQVLSWAFRTWAPRNFHDRIFASQNTNNEIADIMGLIDVCVGLPAGIESTTSLPIWESVAQSWILHEQTRDLLDYLLPRKKSSFLDTKLDKTVKQSDTNMPINKVNGSLLLGLYTTETSATVEKWENLKDHSLDRHMLRMVATLAITGLCFANCLETSDMHRAEQLRASNSRLMELLFSDLSSPTCEISKIDCLLDLFAHGLVSESHRINVCVSKIAGRLLNILEDRRETIQPDSAIQRNDSSDIMDFDTDFESQLTTHATPVREIWPPRKVISNNYSASAQRASVTIYAKLMHALSLSDKESNDSIAETFIARILELPTSEILASGPLLTTLPHYGIKLTPKQFEPLLEFFADNTLSSYLYERAETNMDLLLGVMDSFVQAWTDSSEPDFYVFGLDIYKWFTVTAMKAGLLSPCVQKRLVGLLLQILQIDVDYGKTDNLPSVQSTLFRLMKEGNLEVKYCIAQELSSVFKLFPLPVHADILRELIDSLPLETTWIEGMAVRVMVLARLAASWHSLRMRCIYHIFEAAGMMPDLVKFSAASVVTISDELHLKSPQEVFKLFSSQILYTWFEGHAVAELPFEVFGYQDMTDLLNHNLDEVYAQLVIRGKAEEIQWVLEKLKSTEGKVLRSTFSKTLAYTISWDVCEGQGTSQDPSQVATPCESRLRGILKTNAEYYTLVQFNLPDILAQLFASAYHEDAIEKVFEKRSEYGYAKDALSAMKQYGSLDKELPEAQQPRFKGRYLVDQLERACRRTGNKTFKTIKDVLDVPHITVSLGSIIDCMHPAYGPLHACHIVRKLRIFIALAGDDIFQGYPLQTLIRVLKSIIIDPHCSDDSMGVLRYLLERGKDFLRQEISMVTGTILLILLSLKQFMTSRQDKTTQESQYRNTVSKMQTFHDWLVGYLLEFKSALDSRQQAAFCSLVESCRDLELPSTSSTNEVASTMLKGLLDDEECDLPILGPTERKQVVTTLCLHYRTTNWAAQDMFDSDKLSVSYARRVWASIQTTVVADNYRAWAARVLGRAYASTVSLEQIRPTQGLMSHLSVGTGEQNQSTRAIVTKINNLLSSEDRTHVGVAEQSLRKISDRFAALEDHEGAIEFERILPAHVVSAISRAYSKDVPEIKDSEKLRREELWQATRLDPDVPFESWVQNLAASICRWATENPVIGQLERFFRSTNGFSHELFPFIVHLALSFEVEKEQVVRTYLSESFTTHFKSHGINIDSKSRLLLETLLYLLTQPLPGERTRMGRLEWLELDYLLAAEAAGRCNMPTAALYLGEIAAVPECDPRPSRRSLINPVVSKGFSNELLLSIYSRVDDPDSFYGVKQPPSLESVLARVHHEGDGLKGLMLHSARMDAAMRKSGQPDENDSFGLIGSIGTMNLSSLTHDLLHRKGGNQSTVSTTDTMLDAARKLEQWDISTPQTNNSAASTLYCAFRGLSSAVNLESVQLNLNEALGLSIRHLQDPRLDVSAVRSTLSGIAVLNEISELTAVRCSADLGHLWDRMQARQRGWDIGRFNDAQGIVSCRETLFSLLSQNKSLREALHVSIRDCRTIEAKSVISSSRFARKNDLIQQSLTAATYLSQLVPVCAEIGVKVDAAAHFEVATTLWRNGEISTSVQMLQELCSRTDLLEQSVRVGRPGMLAQLGHEVADARLEKPGEVIANYLRPAIELLDQTTAGSEAGKVFHEFASFCDQQLQDPGNLEDFQRLTKLRDRKYAEFQQYEKLVDETPNGSRRKELMKQQRVVRSWYDLDNAEYSNMRRSRDDFVRQSLQNYLRALILSDEFNSCVVRFFALWLEHFDSDSANLVVQKILPKVPSWKFVGLMNQQTSRLQEDKSTFQQSLSALVTRICSEHPYHGIQYIYSTCYSSISENGQAASSRREAAISIAKVMEADKSVNEVLRKTFRVSHTYHELASTRLEQKESKGRSSLSTLPQAKHMATTVVKTRVPPATMSIQLRLDRDYTNIPLVASYKEEIRIANGLSAPKVLVAIGTDGKEYRQLFKGGNDDLRQDAIMEQLFGEVSKMLQHHKTSRQRNLHIRTYKVLPLTSTSGIIEFVPNSIPLGEFLVPAHAKYHPSDLTQIKAREKIGGAQSLPKDSRVKVYREVAAKHQPVLRHFFFERFQDPDDWFQKRLNYTRSTATISILGWILGLGDRHCHNILLDEKSGEAIHIDLGVAFEAGRVLPVPEVVPFRLTRDIVDGMGVTKTEGVFRRCCEFSMDALRAEKDAIMTLLNVLRYDPLYTWTVSPLKARRMMQTNGDDGGLGGGGGGGGGGSGAFKRPEDEAGEAARALAIVEKKLSKTLSTAATVNELIQQASDEKNLAVLFAGWAAYC